MRVAPHTARNGHRDFGRHQYMARPHSVAAPDVPRRAYRYSLLANRGLVAATLSAGGNPRRKPEATDANRVRPRNVPLESLRSEARELSAGESSDAGKRE